MIPDIEVSSSLLFRDTKGLEDMKEYSNILYEDITPNQWFKNNGWFQEEGTVKEIDLALDAFEKKYMHNNQEEEAKNKQNVERLLSQQERDLLINLKNKSPEGNTKEASEGHERMSSDEHAIREQNEGYGLLKQIERDTLEKQDESDAIGQKEEILHQLKGVTLGFVKYVTVQFVIDIPISQKLILPERKVSFTYNNGDNYLNRYTFDSTELDLIEIKKEEEFYNFLIKFTCVGNKCVQLKWSLNKIFASDDFDILLAELKETANQRNIDFIDFVLVQTDLFKLNLNFKKIDL
jgi:hypothetical protein